MPPDINAQQNATESYPDVETSPLWTVDEVAQYLRLNPETIRLMARQSKIPCIKMGRVWRFRIVEIKAWVQLRSGKNSA